MIFDYLSWFDSNTDSRLKTVTIRQLLSHSAGLVREGSNFMWDSGNFPSDTELQSFISTSTVVFDPNTVFKYSNVGFAVLGKVIEAVSGFSYSDYVNENIFKPLKMTNSYVDYSARAKNLATGYGRKFVGYKREKIDHYETKAFQSAAGIISNVEDLTKYIHGLSIGSKFLVSNNSKREMQRIQFARRNEKVNYGLGVMIDHTLDFADIVCHDGGFIGFETKFGFDKKSGIGVIVLTNCLESVKAIIFREIFKTINRVQTEVHVKKQDYAALEGFFSGEWSSYFLPASGNVLNIEILSETVSDFGILKPVKGEETVFIDPKQEGFYAPGERIEFIMKGDGVSYVNYGGYKLIPHVKFLRPLSKE